MVKDFKLFARTEYDSTCDGSYHSLPKCGRPLGMRFSQKNPDLLLIADAYYGFFEANIQNSISVIYALKDWQDEYLISFNYLIQR